MSNIFLFINKSLQKVFSSKRRVGSKAGKRIKIPSPPKDTRTKDKTHINNMTKMKSTAKLP